MKAEKCIEMLNYVIAAMTKEEKQDVQSYMNGIGKKRHDESYVTVFTNTVPFAIAEMMRVLTIECAKENDKSNGKSKQAAVIKSVFRQINGQIRPIVTYIVNGKQVVCDGYRVFEFNEICNSVPIGTEEETKKENPEKYIGYIDEVVKHKNIELPIPERGKLAAYIKAEKARLKANGIKKIRNIDIRYNFGTGLPMVSAEFLLDAIDGIPDGKLYATTNIHSEVTTVTPLVMLGDNGRTVLMPIKKLPNEYNAEGTEL